MLIVGGLIGFGIAALLLAILLIRGEGDSKPDIAEKAVQPEKSAAPQPGKVTVSPEKALMPIGESERAAAVHGQIQELSSQLRALHKQASDFEQHLDQISTAFEQALMREQDKQPTLVDMPAIQLKG